MLRGLLPLIVYQGVFLIAAALWFPVLAWRLCFDRRYRAGFWSRSGRIRQFVPGVPRVWVHGVSVGEVKNLASLIEAVATRYPGVEIVVSATTPTGFDLARRLYVGRPVIQYPLDFGLFPGRALDRVQPSCVLLMELEIWPNFLQAAARRGVPVAVVNGRISERSFRGYRMARGLLPQFDWIEHYCVQNEAYRERLLALGVEDSRIAVTGNMKFDGVGLRGVPEASAKLRRWLSADGQMVVVAGSTHPREEEWIAEAMVHVAAAIQRPLRLVLAPRHPERAVAVVEALASQGHRVVRWSKDGGRELPLASDAILLVDTIGHLESFYGACDVAFVGGSLVPHGGQNMIEPAALGRAVVFGPYVSNFRADVELLLLAEAVVQVQDQSELAAAFGDLLSDAAERTRLGQRAVEVIRSNQGATTRTLELVAPLLDRVLTARPGGVDSAAETG
ncbi:MAG: 3-deoxy-D-manno-octulosonic acid transferase [Planctomycetota bacterium]